MDKWRKWKTEKIEYGERKQKEIRMNCLTEKFPAWNVSKFITSILIKNLKSIDYNLSLKVTYNLYQQNN